MHTWLAGLVRWLTYVVRRIKGAVAGMTTGNGHERYPRTHPAHLTFYRYGEVTVLWEQVDPEVEGDLDPGQVKEAFALSFHKEQGFALFRGHPWLNRGGDGLRQPVRINRDGEPVRLLQTLNLSSWQPDLEEVNDLFGHNPKLDDAVREVPRAVQAFNANARSDAPLIAGNWRVVSASPNWRATPFCWIGDGGPGGRPVKAAAAKSFRPGGDPARVREAVARCLPDQEVSEHVTGLTRVAILDTWPMDNESRLACGGTPRRPLEKIDRFLRSHPAAQANPRLVAAATGKLVDPANIRDYVSCQPPHTIPATRYNWDTHRFEVGYDVSDHGLFIADMVKDIAPDAVLSVYRVLTDDGAADLHIVVQALMDAVADAGGDRLVINMSLGFAPPLPLIPFLFADPVGHQRTEVWADRIQAASRPERELERDPQADVKDLAAHGLAVKDEKDRLVHLAGSLELVDYLYRLPEKQRAFAVASAGNDSNGPLHRFPPRLPAIVEGVLGVSARGASFSNRDDVERERDDGVSAFGGEAATIGGAKQTVDGSVGLSVLEDLPPTGPPPAPPGTGNNVDGWARWAGTSFAAPIASGLAACVWAEQPGMTTTELMTAVVGQPGAHRDIEIFQA